MQYPVKKIFITQQWGVNPNTYSKFGFKGHNGIDLRIFNEYGEKDTEGKLYAPHDGVVKEATFDADGYGWYYKIENNIEGSILGHNKELFFKVGDVVKQGQEIAIADNTGWSTGSHIHWGYYRFPRNKQNGYGGTINQLPFIKETMSDPLQECLKQHTQLVDEAFKREERIKELEAENKNLKEQLVSSSQTSQKAEIEAFGKTWVVNGVEVDSTGKVTANYKVK